MMYRMGWGGQEGCYALAFILIVFISRDCLFTNPLFSLNKMSLIHQKSKVIYSTLTTLPSPPLHHPCALYVEATGLSRVELQHWVDMGAAVSKLIIGTVGVSCLQYEKVSEG